MGASARIEQRWDETAALLTFLDRLEDTCRRIDQGEIGYVAVVARAG